MEDVRLRLVFFRSAFVASPWPAADVRPQVKLPDGVFNLVHGTGAVAGQSIVAHKDVPLISFTGGTVTGAVVNTTAAPLFKKVEMR